MKEEPKEIQEKNDKDKPADTTSPQIKPKKKTAKAKTEPEPQKNKRKISSDDNDEIDSPIKKTSKKKKALIESDEESSPVKTSSKKKRSIIESDDEEMETKPEVEVEEKKPSPTKSESPEKKTSQESPKPEKKKSVSNFFSPKPSNSKSKSEVKPEVKSEPSTPVAAESKKKNAFAGFFSPKPGGPKRNEGGSDFNLKVSAASFHPVDSSFWSRGEPTPFLALAKTLESIEATSGRLKTIEILSNYFRSVMTQTPADLLASVYMTLGRLAPAWEGVELGIGDSILMKAIAVSCGRSPAQIKSDTEKLGDLGLVAEHEDFRLASQSIVSVVRHTNTMQWVGSIADCPHDLSAQGQLLKYGPVQTRSLSGSIKLVKN